MGIKVELIDTSGMSEDQGFNLYMKLAELVAVREKYEVRHVFGSRRNPEYLFGGMVPALVVYYDDKMPQDVYPHKSRVEGAPTLKPVGFSRNFVVNIGGRKRKEKLQLEVKLPLTLNSCAYPNNEITGQRALHVQAFLTASSDTAAIATSIAPKL